MDLTETQQERYERLIENEDSLVRQLTTCELVQEAILDERSVWEELPDFDTVETILKSVLSLDTKLRLDLLNLRLEKKKFSLKSKFLSL